jgi:hypothetical protein
VMFIYIYIYISILYGLNFVQKITIQMKVEQTDNQLLIWKVDLRQRDFKIKHVEKRSPN